MGRVVTNEGSVGAPPTRSRPHWWVILALSLSLLALVAAATTDHPRPVASRTAETTSTTLPNQTGSTTPQPSGTTTTVPSPSPHVELPSTAALTSPTSGVRDFGRPSTPTTTAPASATPPGGTTGGVASPVQPAVPTETQTGDLQQPDDASANYSFTGSGSMTISATWTTASTLSLTVTCPGGSQTAEGASKVDVVLPDTDGACEATLRETVVEYDDVPYTLTIGPTGG